MDELGHIERILNGHALQLSRALVICHKQGDMKRLKSAMINSSIYPPPLRSVRKDHKAVPENQKMFGPPSRPIGDGNSAPDSQLSWILTQICHKAADAIGSRTECRSTEEMLAEIDIVNGKEDRPHNQVCLSMDAVALYPSLEKNETAKICSRMIANSGLWLEAVDWNELGLYLVLTNSAGSVPAECLPTRKYRSGAAPTITTSEVLGPMKRKPETSKFDSPLRQPEPEEAIQMLQQAIEQGILTVMSYHTYTWNEDIRLQSNGGPIGDRLAEAAARLVLIWFDREFLLLVETAKINLTLYKRFVDDGNILTEPVPEGLVWCPLEKKLIKENSSSGLQHILPEERTATVIKEIANSISPMLSWTTDIPSANSSGKMPVLDLACWCTETEDGTILNYEFYSKPMANPVCLPANSAISTNTKFNTYRQEVFRVLSNTAVHLPWEVKARHLTHLSRRMYLSGYAEGFRVKVFNGGLRNYLKCLERTMTENIPLHRPRNFPRKPRKNQNNWFKGPNSVYDSVLYVPATKNSVLAKQLQHQEELNIQGRENRIKIVEMPGRTLRNVLARNYPWDVSTCNSPQCFQCSTESNPRLSCRKPGIAYVISCTKCAENGSTAIYHGESSKCGFERGKKHLEQFGTWLSSHCMVIHNKVHHDCERTMHFKFTIVKRIDRPMDRQIEEALRIKHTSSTTILMNSGAEWRGDPIPRAAFVVPGRMGASNV